MRNLLVSLSELFRHRPNSRRRRQVPRQVERLEDRSLLSSTTWATALGAAGSDIPVAIAQAADGGYGVVGTSTSFNGQDTDIWLTRFDADGNLLWTKSYDGSFYIALTRAPETAYSYFTYDTATDLAATSDGGFVITGQSALSPGNAADGLMLRVDSSGVVVDVALHSFNHGQDVLTTATPVPGNGVIVAGHAELEVIFKGPFVDTHGYTRFANINGTLYGGANAADLDYGDYPISEMISTSDLGLALVGSEGGGNETHTYVGIKSAASNRFIVGSFMGTASYERGVSIAETPVDPEQPTAPRFYGVASETIAAGSGNRFDTIIRKLDASLVPVWEVSMGYLHVSKILSTADGGFIVAGMHDSITTASDGSGTASNAVLLKLNADGELVWARTYGGVYDEGAPDPRKIDVVATADGFAFTVATKSFGAVQPNDTTFDYWVVKTDADGNVPIMTGVVRDVTNIVEVTPIAGTMLGTYYLDPVTNYGPLFGGSEQYPNEIPALFPLIGGVINEITTTAQDVVPRLQSTPTYNSGSVQFAQDAYQVDEQGNVNLLLTRTDGTHGAYGRVRVNYTITAGGNASNLDYFPQGSGFVQFEDGELTQTIQIEASQDADFDPGEFLTVTLADSDLLNDVVLGARASTTVSINNTTPSPGDFEFSVADYTVDENKKSVTVTVVRNNATETQSQVNYATVAGGSATAGASGEVGADYGAVSGQFDFYGNITSFTFTIPIFDDGDTEGDETIHLLLSSPTNGGQLGTNFTAVVTIQDIEPVAQPIQPKVNGKIAFLRDEDSSGLIDIYVMNANGTGTINVTNSPLFLESGPSWSPDGSKLVFYGLSFGDPELPNGIYSMNADGTGRTLLVESSSVSDPVWSPDGSRIAYIDNGVLATMDADGSSPELLEVSAFGPIRWSPDGTHLAYLQLVSSPPFTLTPAIFEVGIDGFGVRQLFIAFASADEYSYSPDGTQMVFRGELDGVTGVYQANIDGSGVPQRLADQPVNLFLSPDGTKLVYTLSDSLTSQIFVSNLDGSAAAPITTGNPLKFSPVWQPLLAGGGDTTAPVPLSVVANLANVNDGHVGTATFTITVVFDEAMNTAVIPTLTFPTADPGATLSLNAGQSGWTSSTTYVAKYDVTDADVAVANVDVRVAGAKDVAGNVQAATTFTNRFSIAMIPGSDSIAPTVTKFERFNPLEFQTNAPAMIFRATFSEPVDSSTVDVADFIVSGGATATVSLVDEVAGTNGTVYEVVVQGGNLSAFNGLLGLDVSASSNITDLSGNALVVSEPPVDEVYSRSTVPTLIVGGPAVSWKNKQTAVKVLPQITIGGDSFAGGTLVLSINAVLKKGKPLDSIVLPNVASIGASQASQVVNGKLTLQIQLGANATSSTIQSFLRGITFSTKGPGFKVSQRTVNLTLTNSFAQFGLATQTINVSKK